MFDVWCLSHFLQNSTKQGLREHLTRRGIQGAGQAGIPSNAATRYDEVLAQLVPGPNPTETHMLQTPWQEHPIRTAAGITSAKTAN